MAFSYSAAARSGDAAATASTSAAAATAGPSKTEPNTIQHLILDAGPLLSLTPIRHIATSFHTTPMVLAELRDPKARQHWENLKLSGVDVIVEPPTAESMAKVIAFAKKTGDYAVLSQTDLSVVALTYQYEVKVNGDARIRTAPGQMLPPLEGDKAESKDEKKDESESDEEEVEVTAEDKEEPEVEAAEVKTEAEAPVAEVTEAVEALSTEDKAEPAAETPAAADAKAANPPGWDDGEESDGGEWINTSNVKQHRSQDLGLLPNEDKAAAAPLAAACMTGDYAVQNVLLGMGLGLVGEGGKRIAKVRSWVLRCHACFKLCRDSSKRFCPSCGNSSLMRTTVTTSATTGKQTVHLKKNFQYHLRGTKYTIPDAKPGRAKGQQKGGTGLILREDDREWQDAVRANTIRKQKEEKRMARGDGSWMDPDWMPEIITVGMSGKGRHNAHNMPAIGHGRKNPNASRRKK